LESESDGRTRLEREALLLKKNTPSPVFTETPDVRSFLRYLTYALRAHP
jgi:hypothetical protein